MVSYKMSSGLDVFSYICYVDESKATFAPGCISRQDADDHRGTPDGDRGGEGVLGCREVGVPNSDDCYAGHFLNWNE